MHFDDEQLKEQLAGGPLARNGFDDRLRRRIEERIGEESRRTRKPWRTVWRLPAAVLASVTLVLLGIWIVGNLKDGPQPSPLTDASSASLGGQNVSPAVGQEKRYALLIGIRKDEPHKEGQKDKYAKSTYRTVLVAHDGGRLAKVADGKGLFVPHKLDFWKLDTISPGEGRQAIFAAQATNVSSNMKSGPNPPVPGNRLSEKVLFAGNQYVSLQTTIQQRSGRIKDIWQVKPIEQINNKSADPAADPHIRIRDVFPNWEGEVGAGDEWGVDRNPGQWVPVIYDGSGDEAPLPALLPAEIVNRDTLLLSWGQIQQLEPSASDAFSYGNLLGVRVGGAIRVYELENGTLVRQTLTFPLAAGEHIVMLQWAEGSYVDKWIREMQFLSRSS
ncbi:hypothetical protein E5161_02660 [Cohnella pontilimi]|uniref:Uncharacterized protein n=1 Tax=Cohnella pontilimi TaxID=2564100 RepID=A0A4U0FH76_9BACL|nr:hypothetical protein [Cohnella pontilimi]TJY44307.1 hypothetical protein E5161_02660 [Cohnella pontilimi]